jgi:protocatechuate 3,4-dioxygenase beta subunit
MQGAVGSAGMRKGRLVVAGAAIVLAGFLLWWCGHKGGGGVHPGSAPVGGPPPAAKVVDQAAPAPAPAQVAGRVTDAHGKPIEGAIVRLAPREDGEPLTARTGADGGYSFDDVAPGRYAASASAAGFLARAAGDVVLAAGDHRALDVSLDAGGRALSGTVTDATGGPIGGVVVEAAPERGVLSGSGPDVAAAITDTKGHYALTVAEGSYKVSATHAEYVGATRRAEVGPGGATVDFALVPGGVIEGTVEDAATGQGVAGARLLVEREAAEGLPGGAMAGARGRTSTVSDGAGHFRIAGLEPGTIAIRARAPGRSSLDPTVVPLGVAEVKDGVIVVVQAAPSVSGTIVDDAGAPAPEAVAYLTGDMTVENETADASGAFTFEGVKPGHYSLLGGGGGFLDSTAPVAITVAHAPVTGVKLVVRRGATIRGHVDPPSVAHVEVARDPTMGGAMDLHSFLEDRVATEAGPDGAFTLGPVEPGTVDVVARAADGRKGKASVAVAKTGADGVVIHLARGAVLAGRVTDGKDPVAGAVVSARRVKSGAHAALIVNGVDVATERAPTNADGSYEIAGLDPGDYDVQVLDERGGAYAWRTPADKQRPSAPVAVALAADERHTADFEIERPHGVIKGVVLGADGQPVADAWVSASRGFDDDLLAHAAPGPGGEHEESSMMVIRSDGGDEDSGVFGGVPPVLTGADGRFELAHLRRGKYAVLAEGAKGRSRGSQDDVEPDADITIKLADLTALDGTVSANGAPVDDFTVELAGPVRRSQRFLAAAGHFTIQRVDPGTYDVTVTATEGTGHAQVVVASGQTATVAVTLVGHARVTGKIVDATGAPVAGAPVVVVPAPTDGKLSISMSGPPDTTGADGSFAIDAEPGKRLLVVLGGNGPIVTQPIEVQSGQQVDLGTITATPHAHPPPAH